MREIKTPAAPVADNLIDKAIAIVAPGIAVKRRRARTTLALTGGYTGARRNRRQTQTWTPSAGSPDADINPDLPELRIRSRDLARNQPIAHGAIETKVTNVIGGGLFPTPAIDWEFLGLTEEQAAEWHAAAAREWKIAEKTLDISSDGDFAEMQELAFRAVLEGGDCFAVKHWNKRKSDVYGTKYRLIEADRCSNPNHKTDKPGKISGGVERDKDGRPVAYHFTKAHPGDVGEKGAREWVRISAFDKDDNRLVLHLYPRLRIGQSRGVPDLATVIEPFKQLGRYAEAELQAAVIEAMFTAFITTETGEGIAPLSAETDQKSGESELEMGSGAFLNLAPGEDVTFANPTRPHSNFDAFVTSVYKQIGVALGLPSDVLLKVFNSSYSASRAALDTAWQYFRTRRKWMVKKFCAPVWEEVIAEAVSMGRLAAPGFFDDPLIRAAYCRAVWTGDGRIHIDPEKEAKAAEKWIDLGIKSKTEVTRETTGSDWNEVHETRKREMEKEKATGMTGSVPVSPAPDNSPDPEGEPADDEDEENGEEGT